jgi:hypothetical protein
MSLLAVKTQGRMVVPSHRQLAQQRPAAIWMRRWVLLAWLWCRNITEWDIPFTIST